MRYREVNADEWRTYTVDGDEVEMLVVDAKWIYMKTGCRKVLRSAILHYKNDEVYDGDMITSDYYEFPETDEEAKDMIANAAWYGFMEDYETGKITVLI